MAHLVPAVFVLLAWWSSTGVILLIDGLPRSTFRFSLAGVSLLALGGLYGLFATSRLESMTAAYLAFCSALAVWAWHELTFLTGVVTGPRKEPCPPEAKGWARFSFATLAVIHHELALALTLVAVVALTWGAPNQVGTWTFGVLWAMRLSAKLNLFLGVRSITTEFVPAHLQYLLSYFRRSTLNPLMPISLVLATGGVVLLLSQARAVDASLVTLVGRTLVATLLGLAVLEHLFLAVPFREALLWRWAVRPGHGPSASVKPDL